MLKDFVEQGKWQYGLIAPDKKILQDSTLWPKPVVENHRVIWKDENGMYEPIIWFGMERDEPIDCWCLSAGSCLFQDERLWQYFWYSSDQKYDWGILLDGQTDSYVYWMFFECGMDEPSIVPVRQTCPIMLDEEDNNDELIIKLEQYLLRQSR